jgi:multiple sugar transport system ATP-binding protein
MTAVSLDRISKRFADDTIAVDEVSLEIFSREFLVLVGPSGCGKSTTLRMIAGLESCTEGIIRIGDRVVNNVAPKDRDVAMVFQNYALYPHMSVYQNLSFGLTLRFGGGVIARGLRKIFQPRRAKQLAANQSTQMPDGIDGQVRQTAARLGIEHLLSRRPHQLSGGERQRVALGRAIVRNPAAFLFDEPLSNLDAKLRQQMRVELRRLHRELQATMVYVTHDQVEAMTLGDRVAVMNRGRILQVGRPLEIYQCPANLFVAQFIGNVPMNLVSGTAKKAEGKIEFEGSGVSFDIPAIADSSEQQNLFAGTQTSRPVVIGFRAEDVAAVENEHADFVGRVSVVDRLGESTLAYLQTSDWVARLPGASDVAAGDRLGLQIDRGKILWFDPDTGQNLLKEKT